MKELTVLETPIYDDLIIEQMDLDDEPECSAPDCTVAAVAALVSRCCRITYLTCASHLIWWSGNVRALHVSISCVHCHHTWPAPHTLDDIYRVVDL